MSSVRSSASLGPTITVFVDGVDTDDVERNRRGEPESLALADGEAVDALVPPDDCSRGIANRTPPATGAWRSRKAA